MCLPFSVLRDVDLRVELPAFKKKAIAELGYGTSAKLLLGFKTSFWRQDLKRSGGITSDEPFQIAWDHGRMQQATAGGLTLYSGGRAGVEVGKQSSTAQAQRLLVGLDKALPGAAQAYAGKAERFHWPSFPLSKGSYPCYKTGQWTTIAEAEIQPVGNLFFAGDHCSGKSQGFMNGAVESGALAAESVLAVLGKRVK